MAGRRFKQLVIDASVARAAGGEAATARDSVRCRDFLRAVLKICHHVVMTGEIAKEWKKHQSRFAYLWRYSMEARKKVDRPAQMLPQGIRETIQLSSLNGKGQREMLKDAHLLEAAVASDRIIVSLDEGARTLFSQAKVLRRCVGRITWVNPSRFGDAAIEWLRHGANPRQKWRLFK